MSAKIADAALIDLERVRSALLREAKRLVLKLDTKRGSAQLSTDREAAANALAVARELDQLLSEAGVRSVQKLTESAAIKALQEVAGPSAIPASAAKELQAIVDGQTAEVAKVFGAAASEMRQLLAVATTSTNAISLADLEEAVAAKLDATISKARPAIDAAVMGAGRFATVFATEQASDAEGFDFVYLFEGPLDKTTRPFCRQHLGKAYTKAALDRLRNGQLEPVSTFCGGYNCRHDLTPLLVATARRQGVEIVD